MRVWEVEGVRRARRLEIDEVAMRDIVKRISSFHICSGGISYRPCIHGLYERTEKERIVDLCTSAGGEFEKSVGYIYRG